MEWYKSAVYELVHVAEKEQGILPDVEYKMTDSNLGHQCCALQ